MTNIITVLSKLFNTNAFKNDLKDISHYCCSVKQEKPILELISKHLIHNHSVNLEYKRKDLLIDGQHIEAKYNYDCDFLLPNSFPPKEKISSKLLIDEIEKKKELKKSIGWSMYLQIAKDILYKEPDFFLWIVVSRNLSPEMIQVNPNEGLHYCWGKENLNVYQKKGITYKQASKQATNAAIKYLKDITRKTPQVWSIETRSEHFSSIYNFILLAIKK